MARTVAPSGPINQKTYLSQSALTRGYAVKAGTVDGTCTAITGAGQRAIGLASTDLPAAGLPAGITRNGDEIGIAGAAVAFGSYVKVDATGRLVAVTGTAGDGEEVLGRAESTTTVAGQELLVFVNPFVL